MPSFDGKTIPIGEIFSHHFFFRVPEYQRPFLWNDDNLQELIDDLIDAPRDRPYFLGTLVLHSVGESLYDVVDGQQRLTALCILLACLRDSPALQSDTSFQHELQEKIVQTAKELDGIPERNRLQVRDLGLFNSLVAAQGGTRSALGPEPTDGNLSRYHRAIRIFCKKLDPMITSELKDFAAFITRKCMVIYLATDTFEDAFHLFTIVNDRGVQLRRIDVLKADNLRPEVISDPAVRTRYAQQWEELEEQLGEAKFEEVFHLMRLIYVRGKPQGDLLKEFRLRIFPKDDTPRRGKDFLDSLKRYVELYDSLFVARDFLEGTSWDSRYKTIMHSMVSEFAASEWKACILRMADKFGKDALYEFALELEKVYLEQWVKAVRKDERYSTYTTLLAAIEDAATSAEVLVAIQYDNMAIKAACRVQNFYNTGYAKYLLLRAEILTAELDHSRQFEARSIEHVLPQNPADGSDWRQTYSQADIDAVVHTVGNLVLLSKSKNSTASRKDFAQKKAAYLTPRVSDFPRSVKVLSYDTWTRELIEERTEDFANSILDAP